MTLSLKKKKKKKKERNSKKEKLSCSFKFCFVVDLLKKIDFSALTWPVVVFAMIGKFFNAIAFGFLYVVTSEVYSTNIRGLGLTVNSSSARIGSTVGVYAGLLVNLCSVDWIFFVILLYVSLLTSIYFSLHIPPL